MVTQREAIEEIQGQIRRAEDWLAEAKANGDPESIRAWRARLAGLKDELTKAQGR